MRKLIIFPCFVDPSARPDAGTRSLAVAPQRALVCPISWNNYYNFGFNYVSIWSLARVHNSVIKTLSAPVPLGQRMIRTCQLLQWTEAAMRVVQHDPLLLNLVNILTWIPLSLCTKPLTHDEERGGTRLRA